MKIKVWVKACQASTNKKPEILILVSGTLNSKQRYPIRSFGLDAKLCPALANPWTVACQAPLSMGFSRQEYWSGLPFASPEDLPDPGIKPRSPALEANSLPT